MLATTQMEQTVVPRTSIISSLQDITTVAAESRLLRSPYVELRRISCEFREGILTLRGCVSSYYLKQIAQNLVGQLAGVMEIDNRVNVLDSQVRS